MTYALASRLEQAVKNAGVDYKKVSGWASRGHGTMGAISSVVCHHTAGPASGNSPSLNVVTSGRPGLSGPLAQLFLTRDGTVYLVAAGLAYHAGVVKSSIYSNSHAIGIEAEATGTSSWPDVQIDAYAKLCKALCKEFGLATSRVVGHKEACSPAGRKIDPNFNMSEFRAKVGGATGGVSTGGGSAGGGSSKSYSTVNYGTTLGLYDKGQPVGDWQRFLKSQGYDLGEGGVDEMFGPTVDKHTRDWQGKNGLKVDGLVGDDSWSLAKKQGLESTQAAKPAPKPASKAPAFPLPKGHYFGPKNGPDSSHSGYFDHREHLRTWQKQMQLRGWTIKADGLYGPMTAKVAKQFQKEKKLAVDGLIGQSTWDAAWTSPVT